MTQQAAPNCKTIKSSSLIPAPWSPCPWSPCLPWLPSTQLVLCIYRFRFLQIDPSKRNWNWAPTGNWATSGAIYCRSEWSRALLLTKINFQFWRTKTAWQTESLLLVLSWCRGHSLRLKMFHHPSLNLAFFLVPHVSEKMLIIMLFTVTSNQTSRLVHKDEFLDPQAALPAPVRVKTKVQNATSTWSIKMIQKISRSCQFIYFHYKTEFSASSV